MGKYISLLHFTEQGIKAIKKSTSRAQDFNKVAEKAGVAIVAQYWTAGNCDGVLILEATNEKKVLHCLAELCAEGNVRTETMQAFTASEFEAVLSS
jgi:uncharacterized protein with GYD domain